MKKTITLVAEDNKIITDGDKNYGKIFHITNGKSDEGYYEIPLSEYKKIKEKQLEDAED